MQITVNVFILRLPTKIKMNLSILHIESVYRNPKYKRIDSVHQKLSLNLKTPFLKYSKTLIFGTFQLIFLAERWILSRRILLPV